MDTGAQVNVLPYGLLCDLGIQPTEIKVAAWGQFPLNMVGESWCKVTYKDTTVQTRFVVVQLPTDVQGNTCLPLFSVNLCNQLHMFKELIRAVQLDGNCSQTQANIDKFETKGIF